MDCPNLQLCLLIHLLLNLFLSLGNRFCIQSFIWCRKVDICASSFWILAIGTSTAFGGVDREELGMLLVPGEDSAWVVSVGSGVA